MNWDGETILAPLTKGGNLPFRRLCVELGAKITMSEMAYSRQVLRKNRAELALLRKHESETCFGVQIAATNADQAVAAGSVAVERGATFVDLNAGCPIHDTVRRGMGATLLRRPKALASIVSQMAKELPVPVTVKIRSGWKEGEINAIEVGHLIADAGAAAVALHARTREQRYTRSADWDLIARLVSELPIPVIGNGDILTHYEARWRREESGCAAVMVARGALFKPWIFREIHQASDELPTAEERVAIYHRLAVLMKEHFRDDDRGHRRAMQFLPWHLGMFCRYRPFPEEEWAERSRQHPLIQTRQTSREDLSVLEALLRDVREPTHVRMAQALWDAATSEDALECLMQIAHEQPPDPGEPSELARQQG